MIMGMNKNMMILMVEDLDGPHEDLDDPHDHYQIDDDDDNVRIAATKLHVE